MPRVIVTSASTSQLETQTKLETPTSLAIAARVRVNELRALSNGSFNVIVPMAAKGPLSLCFLRDVGTASCLYAQTPAGTVYGTLFDASTLLPTDGNDVVLYLGYTSGGQLNLAIGTPGGSSLISSLHGSSLAALNVTGTDCARVRFNTSNYDALWFTAPRTGDARFAKPLPSDGDMLALFYFNEGSGTAAADSVAGGNSFTLNNYTWDAAAGWDSAGGGGGGSTAVLMRRRSI